VLKKEQHSSFVTSLLECCFFLKLFFFNRLPDDSAIFYFSAESHK